MITFLDNSEKPRDAAMRNTGAGFVVLSHHSLFSHFITNFGVCRANGGRQSGRALPACQSYSTSEITALGVGVNVRGRYFSREAC